LVTGPVETQRYPIVQQTPRRSLSQNRHASWSKDQPAKVMARWLMVYPVRVFGLLFYRLGEGQKSVAFHDDAFVQ